MSKADGQLVHVDKSPKWPALADDAPDQETAAATADTGLLDYWRMLVRRKAFIIATTAAGAVLAIVVTVGQTPMYRSRVTLEIQSVNENFLNMRAVNPVAPDMPQSPELDLNTQVKLLQSQSLIERAAKKSGAANRPSVAAAPGRLNSWRKQLGMKTPEPLPPDAQVIASAPSALRVRVLPTTRVIELVYHSPDAQFSADFANAIVEEYIEQKLESRWQSSQHTSDWLTEQMRELKSKLGQSEAQLQAYARESGLLFTSEKDNVADEKLKQLQQELLRAQSERIARQSRFEAAASATAEALPEVLGDKTLQDYQAKLTDLRREAAEAASTLTPEHPKVIKIQAQVAALENALEKERTHVVESIRNEYQAASRREDLLAAGYRSHVTLMSDQSDKVSHYQTLKREVDTTRQLYESMLQRVKEADLASALRASNIRVVDSARTPVSPYKPHLPLNASFGLFTGLIAGVGLAIARERADRSIRQPNDVPGLLNVREIGVIPSIGAAGAGRRFLRFPWGTEANHRGFRALTASEPAPDGLSRQLVSMHAVENHEIATDSFRVVVTSILFSDSNGIRPRVLVVTSASPEEGKTFVTANLGAALAGINMRVLLIDGDLRKPGLHEMFNVDLSPGLTDLVNMPSGASASSFIRHTKIEKLDVLPAGPGCQSSLLYSARLAEIFGKVRAEYDAVLIDTPPMLRMSDARVLGKHADAVILVIRSEQTTRDAAMHACRTFFDDGTRVLGAILNDWNPARDARYGYYNRDYGRYHRPGAMRA